MPTDRGAGQYRFGATVFHARHAPFASLGVHVDWHTPTVDLHIGRTQVAIGRNQWDGKRFTLHVFEGSGHTDHCACRTTEALT